MGISNFTSNNNNGGGGSIPSMPFPSSLSSAPTSDAEGLLINYNEKYKTADAILYRDEIIQQTLSIMIGKNKPNAILVGPAGVGKTKIVEDIARRIVSDDKLIPDQLKNCVLYELPLSNIVAGSSHVGDTEAKIKTVVDFIEADKKRILFIDEIHQLARSSSTYDVIAQILKPALARGTMHVIGATTSQEYKDLADDPALNRRFSNITVDELSKEQTIEILSAISGSFVTHYNNTVQIDRSTLDTVVTLADEYRPAGSHRPDNAITLLDRAIGDAVINRRVQEIKAAELPDKSILQALQATHIIPITERQIKTTAIKLATGNSKPVDINYDALDEALCRIKGQNNVITEMKTILKEYECPFYKNMGDGKKNKPETILFIGPSGVGKTEITKILSQFVSGTEPIILNMTEYNSPSALSRIIGAPPGYVGYSSHAELPFDILSSNPYQIILLDEFEKCDKAVQTLFMQAFDEGYITTSKGDIIDFSKSIIIATTNAGHTEVKNEIGFSTSKSQKAVTRISDLTRWFDTALLNRFNHRITFNSIDEDTYADILKNIYKTDVERILKLQPRTVLPDEIPDDVLSGMIQDTYVPDFGARPAATAIKKYILSQVL